MQQQKMWLTKGIRLALRWLWSQSIWRSLDSETKWRRLVLDRNSEPDCI